MVLHYTNRSKEIACGRNNHDLVSTSLNDRVTCKKCRSSKAFQQRSWFNDFQNRTATEPMGLEEWTSGAMTFAQAAQFSLRCFLVEAEEMAQGLERDLQPLIVNE
ncbi:hypothetical protein [Pseudomonas rubra]|uniref:Uncharacterized protein n=1 Tax=Pseudomonas rubra TaxID=2942627 RepID=A0ABT5P7N8_9PSED|nr:hypothetical protein [Pseudomonas rubra]MDD1014311.1 hypothetical protein [Pseudomonas rubra]MDD1038066.1 hypothetical protein [Pseudomonas rubra]MDD1155499.1 hypothetical protein [Pseudomonas rubra]